MPKMIQYTCRQEFWPALEGALAAHGYISDIPIQRSGSGASAMVMRYGVVSFLFTHLPTSEMVEIEVWGWGEPLNAAIQLFESLPFPLMKPLDVPANDKASSAIVNAPYSGMV